MEVWLAALTVFGVFVREGVEVMILLGAVNAIAKRPLPIFTGGAIGVSITLLAGMLLGRVGQSVMAQNGVALVAAVMMLYLARGLVYWHVAGEEHRGALAARIGNIASQPWALFIVALTFAGRETVDLMIFVEALTFRVGWTVHVLLAIAVAGLCLVVVYSVLDRLVGKLPLRLIFIVSSIWLVVQAALLIWDVIE